MGNKTRLIKFKLSTPLSSMRFIFLSWLESIGF